MTRGNVPKTNAPIREVLASFLQSHPAEHEIWRDPTAAATGALRRPAPTDAPAVQPRKAAKKSVDTSPASSSKHNIMDYFAKSPV